MPAIRDELQDQARSAYADMLNDDERNLAYDQAIRLAVKYLVETEPQDLTPADEAPPASDTPPRRNQKRFFRCCDIGTGSGLLSMMVVRAFKEMNYQDFHVTAYEAYHPMASCAKKVISANHMSDYITVLPEFSYNHDGESPQYDLLVAELLDTELIGEGCLAIYKHAVSSLCRFDCIFIPHEARVFVQPLASQSLHTRHTPAQSRRLQISDRQVVDLKVDPRKDADDCSYLDCPGPDMVDDMQVSQLQPFDDFKPLADPKEIFKFTFNDARTLADDDAAVINFGNVSKTTEPIVLALWWDITMFPDVVYAHWLQNANFDGQLFPYEINTTTLSCAPDWALDGHELVERAKIQRKFGRQTWRDHWIQAIYYFVDDQHIGYDFEHSGAVDRNDEDTTLLVYAYRGPFSYWFSREPLRSPPFHEGSCNMHRYLSRSQLALVSDDDYMTKLLRSKLAGPTTSGDNKTELIECRLRFCRTYVWEIEHLATRQPLLSDPFSYRANAFVEHPWQMAGFPSIRGPRSPIAEVEINFVEVKFDNLHRIKGNIGTCMGFDLSPLDEMVREASAAADQSIESHYLWEYPCKLLSPGKRSLPAENTRPQQPYELDLKLDTGAIQAAPSSPVAGATENGTEREESINSLLGWALVFWAEFKLETTGEVISTGPLHPVGPKHQGSCLQWNKNFMQQVHFINANHARPTASCRVKLELDADWTLNVTRLSSS